MATKKYYIGSHGPFLYDDTSLINDPDGDFAGETLKGLTTSGDVLISGDVGGANITSMVADLDGFPDELKNLTTAEIQQVENIGTTTISAAQWGYLGDAPGIGIYRLASVTAGMQNGDAATNIYTVPTGKSMIVTHCIVRGPTASLAGGTDFDFGAAGKNWMQTVDLSGMTATTHYRVLEGNNVNYTIYVATDIFQITVSTGATLDADATVDLFGYLF